MRISEAIKLLEIPRDADLETVHKQYDEFVKKYPQESYPIEFAKAQEAYNILKDPREYFEKHFSRLDCDDESMEDILEDLNKEIEIIRVPFDKLVTLGID